MENAEELDFDNAAEGEIDEQVESVEDAITNPPNEEETVEKPEVAEAEVGEEASRKRKRDETPTGNKRLKFSILESQEARQVEAKITHLLRNSKDLRMKVDAIQGKLKKRLWARFYDKFKLEVPELLELLGLKFTFEIIEGETWVVLNEQVLMPHMMFPPMPPPFMVPPFAPFGPPFMAPPFFPPKPLNKMNSTMCEVCMIELNSDRVREAHFAGKKHKKRLAQMEEARKKSEAASAAPFLFPNASGFAPNNRQGDGFYPYSCKLCNVPINSKKTEDLHLNGKKHKRKMLEKQTGGKLQPQKAAKKNKSGFAPYMCTFCNADITSAQMETDHKKGRKHQKRMKHAMANPFPVMPGFPNSLGALQCPEVPAGNM